jgi:hypothetical protein
MQTFQGILLHLTRIPKICRTDQSSSASGPVPSRGENENKEKGALHNGDQEDHHMDAED